MINKPIKDLNKNDIGGEIIIDFVNRKRHFILLDVIDLGESITIKVQKKDDKKVVYTLTYSKRVWE